MRARPDNFRGYFPYANDAGILNAADMLPYY
jgi:hypothetical protein